MIIFFVPYHPLKNNTLNVNQNIIAISSNSNNSQNLDLKIYYQNVRGLRTKTKTIYLNSMVLDFDMYVLTETWLASSINDLEIFNSSYIVFRRDRYHTNFDSTIIPKGGGVLIALKNKFNADLISIPDSDLLELICVKIQFCTKNVYVVNCYIPPSSAIEIYIKYSKAIEFISQMLCSSDELLVCGDFNLPNLKWAPHDEDPFMVPINLNSELESTFIDCLNSNYLQQISSVSNYRARQLDLIFSTDWQNILTIDNTNSLVAIDPYHPPICLSYCLNSPTDPDIASNYSFNFKKANLIGLNNYLNAYDFSSVLGNTDISEMTKKFYSIMLHAFNEFIPMKKDRNSNSSPTWFTQDLKKLRNKKNKAWRRYLKTKKGVDFNCFKFLFDEFKTASELLYNNYVRNMSSKLISNPKDFWKFVNSKRKSDQFPVFINFNNSNSSDPNVISEYFQKFFASSYSNNLFTAIDSDFYHMNNLPKTTFSHIFIDANLVNQYLDKLSNDTFPGPDGIPEFILKNCSSALAAPLSSLFNQSISSGIFPTIWKNAFIRPTHKKGPKNDVANYRPIAKLSCIPKVFELIIFDSVYSHCSSLLIPNQHGFVKHKSTITNLVESTSTFINNMEAGFQTDVIYTDFSKAFDILPHSVILLKLKKLGFPEYFLKWINSYLNDRTYTVLFRYSCSSPYKANSGVPQGSHLGPLLFVLSVNDVSSIIINSDLQIYADDMKIFKKISTERDSCLLQKDLDAFSSWCKKNNLLLNVSKCAFMSYSRCSTPININYLINGEVVLKVDSIKDLGVYFDEKLSFKLHFNHIINKARAMLGFIKRWSKEFNDPYILKSLYTTLVRPNLEYASQVWSPFYEVHIKRIESVQKNFLKYALRNLPWEDPYRLPRYENRLNLINLSTLKKRREIADIIFIVDVTKENILSPIISNRISINSNSRLRSVNLFNLTYHRTNYGMYEPIHRMLLTGNKYKSLINFSLSKHTLKHILKQNI